MSSEEKEDEGRAQTSTDTAGDADALAALVHATRTLVDRVRRTRAPAEELAAVRESLLECTARLDGWVHDGPFSQAALDGSPGLIGQTRDPMAIFPYSPVIGRLNPLAPPATFHDVDGRIVGEVTLGPPWCGPPNHVHGGVVAALMDELLGVVNVINELGAMTGRLTIHYHAPTPLGVALRLEGEHTGHEGRKVFSRGRMWHGDVLLCEAEGLFVKPRDTRIFSSLARRDA